MKPRLTKSASPMSALPEAMLRKLFGLVLSDAMRSCPPLTTTDEPEKRTASFSMFNDLPVVMVGVAPKRVVTGAALKPVAGSWIVPNV